MTLEEIKKRLVGKTVYSTYCDTNADGVVICNNIFPSGNVVDIEQEGKWFIMAGYCYFPLPHFARITLTQLEIENFVDTQERLSNRLDSGWKKNFVETQPLTKTIKL